MTTKQQLMLAVRVAKTMKALTRLVGVADAEVASQCVDAIGDELMELDKSMKSCKTCNATTTITRGQNDSRRKETTD